MGITAALGNIAKINFPDGVPHAYYKMNPGFGDSVKKTDGAKGQNYQFTVSQSQGSSGSAQYARAAANASTMIYTRFTVVSVTDYAIARMNGEDIEKLSGDKGAVVDAWKDRIDGAYQEALRSLAFNYFGDGTGVRGIVSSGQATNTITLGTAAATPEPSRIPNFYQGMIIRASATSTGAYRAGSETCGGVDRANGTLLSTSAAWNTVITLLAAGDFLFRDGDGQEAGGTALVPTGMASWLVGGTTPNILWGAQRNVDQVALAGTAIDGTGFDMVESVLNLGQLVSIQDATETKTLYVNPRDKISLVKLLESRVRYMRPDQKNNMEVAADGIEFDTDSGPVKLKGDINVPVRQAFLLATDKCETISVGGTPKILKIDGQEVRARDGFDAYEMRIGSYVNFAHRFPGSSGRIFNWGV